MMFQAQISGTRATARVFLLIGLMYLDEIREEQRFPYGRAMCPRHDFAKLSADSEDVRDSTLTKK